MSLAKVVRKDLLAALDSEDCLVKMVRLELLVLLALLDLLEREASKDSLVLLDSRVCPDLLDHLERAANLVTRVFPERVVPLVLLDQEVSVDSLVREEVLGLRVSRDQEDFLELQELMDLRVR